MNIPINQDIETTYRNEFVKGFSIYEFGFSFGGFVAIALVTILLWWKFDVAFNIGVYAGFPFAIPFFARQLMSVEQTHSDRFEEIEDRMLSIGNLY